MIRKKTFIPIAIFAVLIGLYPLMYLFVSKEYTFLSTKSVEILKDQLWRIFFMLHVSFGGLSLLIGWIQFIQKVRLQKPSIHRIVGFVYILSVLISAISGIYIGIYANFGIISSLGFISLGIVWLLTTILAFIEIKKGNINAHQKWMIFSYAACFSAVTLRIYLPLLNMLFDGDIAYSTVAWLCWVPNMAVAYLIVRKLKL